MSDFIPFALPEIGQEEIDEVVDSLRTGWITTGPKVKLFEETFARQLGVKHCLAVNSATAGLHLGLEAVGVSDGDVVITSPYTFTATAEVIRYLGADPVFIDIDPQTYNLDPQKLDDYLQRHKSAGTDSSTTIMPVHFAGQACDMDHICALSERYNCRIVEDAAHAFPTEYRGKKIGTIGDITAFSFYATKTITTGEGGMIATDNDQYADRIRCMRLHGINRDVFNRYQSNRPSWYYEVIAPGFKYNMPDIAAAIGIHQLRKAEKFRLRRQYIAGLYNDAFKDLPLKLPYVANTDDKHSWHLYVIQLELDKLGIDRERFIELMNEAGVGTSVHFIPLHLQPYWRDRYDFKPEDFPVSFGAYKKSVSLPIYPKMTDEDVSRVISSVRTIIENYST